MDWPDIVLGGTEAGAPWLDFFESLPPGPKAFAASNDDAACMLKGRRAAGTFGLLYWLLHDVPQGKVSQYITKQFKTAREIMWPVAMKANSTYKLGLTLRKGPLEIDNAWGGTLRLGGADDQTEAEKYRGKEFWKVGIDEIASFGEDDIKWLVEDVLDATLADSGGKMALCGTPGVDAMGYFYDRTDGALAWPTHRFNCLTNHHINGLAAIERAMRIHGYGPEHPTLLREWLGKWVRDEASLVYQYGPERNGCWEPFAEGFTTIACDVGYYPDQCGFAVVRSMPGVTPDIHIMKAFRRGRMILPQIAAVLESLQETYSPGKMCRIYVDTAGGSKVLAETLRQQYGLPCLSAYKPDKKTRIESLRGGLQAGTVKVCARECSDLLNEWSVMVWDEDRKSHSENCVDDCSDAVLYAFEKHKHFYRAEREEDKPGSRAWHLKREAEDKARDEEEAMRVARGLSD